MTETILQVIRSILLSTLCTFSRMKEIEDTAKSIQRSNDQCDIFERHIFALTQIYENISIC